MKSYVKKCAVGVAIVAVVGVCAVALSGQKVEHFYDKYADTDFTQDVAGMERTGTYTDYLEAHADAVYAQQDVSVDIFDFTAEGKVEIVDNYQGVEQVLYTDLNSVVSWDVEIPESGYYNLYIEYLLPESRGVAAERAVYINGNFPLRMREIFLLPESGMTQER